MSFIDDLQGVDFKRIGSETLPIKVFFIACLCVAVGALMYYFLIMPQIEELDAVAQSEQSLRNDFVEKQKKASKLEPYKQQLAEMDQTFGSMLKNLPDKTEVDSLLIEISRAGSSNNLKIDRFQPMGERPKEFYAEYPIDMHLNGSYSELTGFVSSIAALQRIVTLHEVDIKPASGNKDAAADKGKINITLVAKTYRYITNE